MEVHKHPHHVLHKKKWPEYLLEFLMIFLAVFLGFLAENVREHAVEAEREKQFIRSLTEDVRSDTAHLNRIIGLRTRKREMFDSLSLLLNSTEREKYGADIYFFGRHVTRLIATTFIYTDGTIQQLKNSGGFRLIRNSAASREIMEYDNRARSFQLQDIREKQYVDDFLQVGYRTFDGLVFDKMVSRESVLSRPQGNPLLLDQSSETLRLLNATLHNVKSVNIIQIRDAKGLFQEAVTLLKTLNREYRLD